MGEDVPTQGELIDERSIYNGMVYRSHCYTCNVLCDQCEVNSRPIFIYIEFGDQILSKETSLTRMLQGFMVGSQGEEFGK